VAYAFLDDIETISTLNDLEGRYTRYCS